MHLHFLMLLPLMCCGFFAGFVDGIAGGGGLIMVPALLMAGIPPHLTLGTNKLAATLGVFASARAYIKKGLFNPLLWRAGILAALLGSALGALAVHFFSARFLTLFLPLIIIGVAAYMLLPKKRFHRTKVQGFKPGVFSSAGLGSALGFYDGFIGPGTGSFWTTAVMTIYKLDIVAASAVARFMNFTSNVMALFTFMLFNTVDYGIGLSVGLFMIAGSYLGAHSAIKYGEKFIKPFFITVVLLLAIRLIYLEWV